LTPFQLDFFELLLDAYPRAVPQAELMAALYDDNDERTDRVLTVQAALMRKRFRNAGLRINISSRRGWDNRSGYFLEIGDAADRNMQVA
jgi:DNA-binding winged helix-turn-helix (wHTH) protein